MKFFIMLKLLLLMSDIFKCDLEVYRQEGAKITYLNPKYVKDAAILTRRSTRRAPYLTNINGTNLHPWGNNITATVKGYNMGVQLFNLEFKICDLLNIHWATNWLKTYSDVPSTCPVPANAYYFKDIELPPKNFPIQVPPGDYIVIVNFVTTKEKDRLLEIKLNLKFLAKKTS